MMQYKRLLIFQNCFCCQIVQAMRTYGYEIVQTLIVDIEPDVTVKRAMNEINAGRRPIVPLMR
jgi:hypothetical protein